VSFRPVSVLVQPPQPAYDDNRLDRVNRPVGLRVYQA
jgi:hypothetical protein